jgi:hypothetical protein
VVSSLQDMQSGTSVCDNDSLGLRVHSDGTGL